MLNIGSFCVTANHWSDEVTSVGYVQDIAVPYFKKKICDLRKNDPSACKPFGEQVCVLIVDCWYGWLDVGFRAWVATKYPWIRLIFVPAACTPKAQPMDAGIIAKIKGILRRLYGKWVCDLVQEQFKNGTKPEDINVPNTVPQCKRNLCNWLSQTVDELNKDKAGIEHCWKETELSRAWEPEVQIDAVTMAQELFPNLVCGEKVAEDTSSKDDEQAGALGQAFTETESEEWEGWVNWEEAA